MQLYANISKKKRNWRFFEQFANRRCTSGPAWTVSPESSVSPATIFGTTENCQLAINGMAKMMTSQYLSTQGLNGEGTIKTWYDYKRETDYNKLVSLD